MRRFCRLIPGVAMSLALAAPKLAEAADCTGCANPSFADAVRLLPVTFPADLASADLNGDGVPDLVVADIDLIVFLGTGDGSFGPPLHRSVGFNPLWVAVADFDGDGIPDVVTTDSHVIRFLKGTGDGTLEDPVETPALPAANFLRAADFNGDGIPDLALGALLAPSGLAIALGNGDGTFQPPINAPGFVSEANSLAIADFDRDGNLDIVAGGGPIATYLGNVDCNSVLRSLARSARPILHRATSTGTGSPISSSICSTRSRF